jgi:hypothetical protein
MECVWSFDLDALLAAAPSFVDCLFVMLQRALLGVFGCLA